MSYDLYCYKSEKDVPDPEEADNLIQIEQIGETPSDLATKEKICAALLKYNPSLERFKLDYEEIAKFDNLTVEEAKKEYNYIELNTPEGELAVQLTIYNRYVHISVPY